MALVISAGIDKSTGDQIELTVQVFIPNPAASGAEGNGGGQGNVYTLSSKGDSMPDALSELQKKLPRYFSWGHAKAYFFGEDLAREGMSDEFDFLFRDIQPREQSNFFICRGTAKKLLESQVDPNTYETLIKLGQKPLIRSSTMHEIEDLISSESQSFILPMIAPAILMTNKDKMQILTVDGVAVIHGTKLRGFLDHESVMGMRLLKPRDLGRNITLTQELNGGKIAIKILHTKVRLDPSIENGNWKMKVKLSLDADIVQNSSHLVLAKGADTMRQLETPFNEKIKGIIKETLRQVQDEQKSDVVGFARAFHKKYPKEWKMAKKNWEELFETMEVEVEVDSSIQRPGIVNLPMRQERDEVRP